MKSKKKLLFVSFSTSKNEKENGILKKRDKFVYFWRLERFKATPKDLFDTTFPMSPLGNGIQNIKEDLISKLNSQNLFDFDYLPKENDFLSIYPYDRDSLGYLNLVYMENAWLEEYFLSLYRDPVDEYTELRSGRIDLSSYI